MSTILNCSQCHVFPQQIDEGLQVGHQVWFKKTYLQCPKCGRASAPVDTDNVTTQAIADALSLMIETMWNDMNKKTEVTS